MNSKRIDSNQGRRTPNHWQKTPLTWMRLAPPYSMLVGWRASKNIYSNIEPSKESINAKIQASKQPFNHSTALFSLRSVWYTISCTSWRSPPVGKVKGFAWICRVNGFAGFSQSTFPFSKTLGVFAVQDGVFVTLDIAARRFALPRCLDAEGGGRWLVWRIDKLLYSDEIDVRGRYTCLYNRV